MRGSQKAESLTEDSPNLGRELRSLVRDNMLDDSMKPGDMSY